MSQFPFDQDSGGVYNPFEATSAEQAGGDAVHALQLPLASRGKRLVGSIIDSLLGALAVLPGLVIMGAGFFTAMSAATGPGGNGGMPPAGFAGDEFPGVVSEGPAADGNSGFPGEFPPLGDSGADNVPGGWSLHWAGASGATSGCGLDAGWRGSGGGVGAAYLRTADLPFVYSKSVGWEDLHGHTDC